jgi:polyisoprenoid-binding protein YceI
LFVVLLACSGSEEASSTPAPEPTPAPEETPAPTPEETKYELTFTDSSKLTFVSTKNEGIEVPGSFTTLSGGLNLEKGDLSTLHGELVISLGSVDTANPDRDKNLREALFGLIGEAMGDATVTITEVQPSTSTLEVGATTPAEVSFDLTLVGNTTHHKAKISLGRTADGWTVATLHPVALSLHALGLKAQGAALKARCGHAQLGDAVMISVELALQ